MGLFLWRVKYEILHDGLTSEDLSFFERYFPEIDVGIQFSVDKEILEEVKARLTSEELERYGDILKILEEQIEKNGAVTIEVSW